MILGCLDAVLLFPIGLYSFISDLMIRPLPFWLGWTYVHSDWAPFGIPASAWKAGISSTLQTRYDQVVNPILAIVFFLIFGLTKQARAKYWSAFYFILRPFGLNPPKRPASVLLSTVDFEAHNPTFSSTSSFPPDSDSTLT